MEPEEMHELALNFEPYLEWEPNPRDSSKILGLYYNIVERSDHKEQICIQYYVLFDKQVVPAHPFDYEPIFVYLDTDKNVTRVVYDKYHYCASTIKPYTKRHQAFFDKGRSKLKIFYLWHGLSPTGEIQSNYSPELIYLDDSILSEWQSREGEAKFIIPSEFLVNPFQIDKYFKHVDQKGKTLCRIKNMFRARDRRLLKFVRERLGGSERLKAGFTLDKGWIRDLVTHRMDEGFILKIMQDSGLIELDESAIRLTDIGALFYNTP